MDANRVKSTRFRGPQVRSSLWGDGILGFLEPVQQPKDEQPRQTDAWDQGPKQDHRLGLGLRVPEAIQPVQDDHQDKEGSEDRTPVPEPVLDRRDRNLGLQPRRRFGGARERQEPPATGLNPRIRFQGLFVLTSQPGKTEIGRAKGKTLPKPLKAHFKKPVPKKRVKREPRSIQTEIHAVRHSRLRRGPKLPHHG